MRALLRRLRARRRLRAGLGLWYHPDYAPACLARTGRVPAVHLDRVELAVGQLAHEGLLRPGDLRAPGLASFEDLARVHTPGYLESVADPDTLGRILAVEPRGLDVDAVLRAQRRAVGGTVEAACSAAREERRVAFNLGGGFHHAEPDRGAGFCIFNDVAVAIAVLRAQGHRSPVAVVDLDFHQGNGTLEALAADRSVLHYSIDGTRWTQTEPASGQGRLLARGADDEAYLSHLRGSLPEALARHRPALVFYVAGHDVLAEDPLGGFALTHAGVLARDRLVCEAALAAGARPVVTLGGGYRADAWQCIANLLRFLLTGEARAEAASRRGRRERFAEVARALDPSRLQAGEDGAAFTLTEGDLMGDLAEHATSGRVLGYYSAQGIEYALERYGVLEAVRKRGFVDPAVEVDTSHSGRQMVRLTASRGGRSGLLLLELVVGRRFVTPPAADAPAFELLAVEWLLLQDPTQGFSLAHPPLPEQKHPGLGLARDVQELLIQAARRLGLDGLVHRPSHYHLARVAYGEWHFLDPEAEGRFLALQDRVGALPLVEATAAVEGGAVEDGGGRPFRWEPSEQVFAVSEALGRHLASPDYAGRRDAAREAWRSLRVAVAGRARAG
jgi:acetoin utilization deacetylase AcuC-like enzyme